LGGWPDARAKSIWPTCSTKGRSVLSPSFIGGVIASSVARASSLKRATPSFVRICEIVHSGQARDLEASDHEAGPWGVILKVFVVWKTAIF
jgi:hypothetical protein